MHPRVFICVTVILSAFCSFPRSFAQAKPAPDQSVTRGAGGETGTQLKTINHTVLKGEPGWTVTYNAKCDSDRNLYLSVDMENPKILKLSPKGERLALISSDGLPDLKVMHAGHFGISTTGEIYELAYVKSNDRYILTFASDGRYKTKIKLQPGFDWIVSRVAQFPSGAYLVTGLRWDDNDLHAGPRFPVTAIFSTDGTLLKLVKLDDDEKIVKLAEKRDQVVAPSPNSHNYAVELGSADAAPDGNIYVMRRLSPAQIYAISPGGEVLKQFKVDPGEQGFLPVGPLHISGNQIAILFHGKSYLRLVKVVDLDGRGLATYRTSSDEPSEAAGTVLACYSQNEATLTFMDQTDDGTLTLNTATPR